MNTTPVTSTSNTPANAPSAGSAAAGFHLPSYLLGLVTALLLLGGALFFWPRPQPAALQLQAPPTLPTAPAAVPTAAATLAPTPSPLVVFVSGAVAQPGLYTLAPFARIGDAIAAAGGLLPGVDAALLNQAQPLVDGAQLHIPAPTTAPLAAPLATAMTENTSEAPQIEPQIETEANVVTVQPTVAPTLEAASAQPPAGLSTAPAPALPTPTAMAMDAPALPARAGPVELPAAGSLINVNTATSTELESLPGIGPTKAQAIIANRPYANVEDLDRVPGIGPATMEQLRPLVTTE